MFYKGDSVKIIKTGDRNYGKFGVVQGIKTAMEDKWVLVQIDGEQEYYQIGERRRKKERKLRYRGIRAVLMAVLVVSSLWVGIGLGIASTERKPSAEVRSIGENRIEIWKGGVVVIWTTQENVTNWGDYIIVKEE